MKIISFIKSLFREKSEPEILLKYLKKHPKCFETGLCLFISILKQEGYINVEKYIKLSNWISRNKPITNSYDNYWFPKGDLQSRIDYLKSRVKKQEEIAK